MSAVSASLARPAPLETASSASRPDAEAARKAGQDFEALFLAQLLAPVFEGVGRGGFFGGGEAEGVYRSLLVEEYGKVMARAGGIGVADIVAREILKAQEAAS